MRRIPWGLGLCVLILGVALASCNGPNRGSTTQPSAVSGLTLDLTASPNVLRGQTSESSVESGACALVQAKVWNTNGELVDNVDVLFTTTLCCFAGTDKVNLVGVGVRTVFGTATVPFCATKQRGTAIITAAAEDAFDTVLITVF